jgi:heterodisulfide reductase subunit A2
MTDETVELQADQPDERPDAERRIGVFICHCGGNISDYVDVAAVRDALKDEEGVVVAETTMFACSDGTQHDMIDQIREQGLDGLVVASCSPKLHQITFRGVSKRADLNPYAYSQVNIREQDSWAHGDDPEGATEKAISLVRAGIARTRNSTPLVPLVVETTPATMVVGAGIAGMRAAIGLADTGLHVYLVEREVEVGGWAGTFGSMFPNDRSGREQIEVLKAAIAQRPSITVFTNAELVGKSGSFGNYEAVVRVNSDPTDTIRAVVGSVVIATGFDSYQPEAGEFGYGIPGVVTLPEFKAMVDSSAGGSLVHEGRPIGTVAYVYCVGNRQPAPGNEYCSKFCCAATAHASLLVNEIDPSIHQFHLNRGVRTYGKYELMYTQARENGAVYMTYPDDTPPAIEQGKDGSLAVTVTDTLTGSREVTIPADLVVLVTGMVPRCNDALTDLLKLPVGDDGFYNEIHPKLRPVETVVDGVLIAGSCQGPKTATESVASGMAAVAQSAAILKKGIAELDPLVAMVHLDGCTGCRECLTTCPYDAIEMKDVDGRTVAEVAAAVCKGCGGCVPLCPEGALDLLGYTDAQMTAMIDSLVEVPVS